MKNSIEKIANTFNLAIEDATLVDAVNSAWSKASNAVVNLTSTYEQMSERLDKTTDNKFSLVKFNKVKAERGSDKYAEQCTNTGSEFDLSGTTVQWIDSMRKALDNDQAWQNVCKWSLGYAGKSKPFNPKHPNHPDNMTEEEKDAAILAKEAEKSEKDKTPKAKEAFPKVLKALETQYQYLGKVEEMDENVINLMHDIAEVLRVHGVDLEAL